MSRVTKNYIEKTVTHTKVYDSDDFLETDVQDLANRAVFKHPKNVSGDDDDATSQATNSWPLDINENLDLQSPGPWDHFLLNVKVIKRSKSNPWEGIGPLLKSPNETPEGFGELKTSENNVEEPPPSPPSED